MIKHLNFATRNSFCITIAAAICTAAVALAPTQAWAGGGKLPPLTIVKKGPDTIKPGETIVYDIVITNSTKHDYHKVDIHEVLPPHLTFVQQGSSSECGYKGGKLGCWIKGIWGKMTKTYRLVFKVSDKAPCNFQLVNQVDVVAKNAEPNWAKKMTVVKCEPKKQCSDGIDNDGDGWIDLDDPGCTSPNDDDEFNKVPQCKDGKDNDGDGWIDLDDPGCSSPNDDDEFNKLPQCKDGKDNDGDGWIDLDDSGCTSPEDDDESNPLPQCKDGKDNDGDGWIDLDDSGCTSPDDNDESNPLPQCKDGKDNDGDGWIDLDDSGCSSPEDNDESNPLPQCKDGKDNDGDGKIDLNDPGCSSPHDDDEWNAAPPQCSDGKDNDGDGWIDLDDSGCTSPNDNDESNPLPQCKDGKDNDGDGWIDLDDSGCSSPDDNDESNPLPQCSDGKDNDGDGKVDFPADKGCSSKHDNDEKNNTIALSKTGPATVSPGGTISYAITVGNPNAEELKNVNIFDRIPANLTFTTTGSTAGCKQQADAVRCDGLTIAAGGSTSVTLVFTVADKAKCDSQIVNQVDVSASNADTNWAKAMSKVECKKRTITLQKTGPATVNPGGTVSYTITVGNPNDTDLTNVSVHDGIPAGLTFVQGQSSGECSKQGAAVKCTGFTLGAGQNKVFTLTFTVADNTKCDSQIVNQVDVSATNADSNWAKATSKVECKKRTITIQKSGPATVNPGNTISYTITVGNPNDDELKNVNIFDRIPAGLTFTTAGSTTGCKQQADAVRCDGLTIAAGGSTSVTLVFTVSETAKCDSQIVNQADVSATNADSNWAKAMTKVECKKSTITVTKSGPAKVHPGDEVTYTINVSNPNQNELKNITLHDGVVAGLTYAAASSSNECSQQGGAIKCAPFSLAAGANKSFTLTFTLSADAKCDSKIVNQVDVSATNADSNWAKATTIVECKPVSPILPHLECVYDLGGGKYRAYFGYDNTGSETVTIAAGTEDAKTMNKFVPDPKDRGQTSTFKPGRVKAAFFVDFDGSEISWKVRPENGAVNVATASKKSAACKQVEPIAECVDKKPGGKFFALFGYKNTNDFEIKIPIGASNKFVPAPEDRGQPDGFFKGLVASAFNVEYNSEQLTWKLGTLEAVAKYGKVPQCTPNSAPKCDAGGAYNAQCQGPESKIHLDGTKSSDPDGAQLTYKWTTDCAAAAISDANAAQPVLTLDTATDKPISCKVTLTVSDEVESSSCSADVAVTPCNFDCLGVPNGTATLDLCGVCNGNNACVDCAGVPFGNAKVDKCGVCGGNDACVDCAGVVNGSAVLDRCGVCNGDGNSCLGCKTVDITDSLFAMDSAALLQRNLNLRAARKIGRNKGATKQTKALATAAAKESDALYQEAWGATWSIGRQVINCTNTQVCAQNDRIEVLASYNTNSVRLRDIGLELSRACLNLSGRDEGKKMQCRKISKEANDLHSAAVQSVTQIPRFTSSCG
ncbi:MAG: DUF11 domain-containing protein [Deltaproteobacteria bacterium]|nr:DUF11 domain-containing protein [Deltaproteobacteria bacterium]